MAQMHTLVLNGQSYALTDASAARIDDTVVGEDAWSAKKLIDTLCPAFHTTGGIVNCTPVEGYPLEVVTQIPEAQPVDSLTLRQTGKNLWDFKSGLGPCRGVSASSGADILRYGYIVTLPPGTYTVSAQVVTPGDYIYFNPIDLDTLIMGALTYFITGDGTAVTTVVTLKEGQGLYFYDAGRTDMTSAAHLAMAKKAFYENVNIQIQEGKVATPYTPFGQTHTVTLDAPFSIRYSWPAVIARAGENCIYSSGGQTTVSGREDIRQLLKEAQNV